MQLLGSGPDMAGELKDGDRAEGGAEGSLPQRSYAIYKTWPQKLIKWHQKLIINITIGF